MTVKERQLLNWALYQMRHIDANHEARYHGYIKAKLQQTIIKIVNK